MKYTDRIHATFFDSDEMKVDALTRMVASLNYLSSISESDFADSRAKVIVKDVIEECLRYMLHRMPTKREVQTVVSGRPKGKR